MNKFNFQFNQTTIHPLALVLMLALGALILALPRKWVPAPMLVMACFISAAQSIVVLGCDFQMLRILVLFAWIRIFFKRDYLDFEWKKIDSVFCAWMISHTLVYTLQRMLMEALVYRLGEMYTGFGFYFAFRCFIRSTDDLKALARFAALLAVPVSLVFLNESLTGRNWFSFLGGVPEITFVREGKLRCQGAFPHPIIAGGFWAALMPFIAVLWFGAAKDKALALPGMLCTGMIILACSSSTPVMGLGLGAAAACLWPLRHKMRQFLWVSVGVLFFFHLVKPPVWALIGRVSDLLVSGSTGYHRVRLITAAIDHFWEWALLGTRSTSHWGWGLFDVTNQFIIEGVRGGMVTLCLFCWFIWLGFKGCGQRRESCEDPFLEKACWATSVGLFIHCSMFISVAYFGQLIMIFYLQLAVMGSLTPLAGALAGPAAGIAKEAGSPLDRVPNTPEAPWLGRDNDERKSPWKKSSLA